jgi:hypothetical protein
VKKAIARVEQEPEQRESYVELAVAHTWLIQGEAQWPGFHVEMTREILLLGEPTSVIWTATLSQMLAGANQEREDIAEGVHFEHDGNTYQAVEVGWLTQLVRGNA